MRRIALQQILIDQFKAFRRRETLDFLPAPGLKFLSGDNQVDMRLGANGAGKTSLWEALFWCCYGAGIKGQRTSELASWGIDKCRPYVGLKLLGDGAVRLIERRGSPNDLRIDGRPAEQQEVDALLGLTRQRFAQSVLFGQGVPFFVDLSIPQRGELLDEVLDLGVWLRASAAAAITERGLARQLSEVRTLIAGYEGRLSALTETTLALHVQADEWGADYEDALVAAVEAAEAAEKAVDAIGEFPDAEKAREVQEAMRLEEIEATKAGKRVAAAKATLAAAIKAAAAAKREAGALREDDERCITCGQPMHGNSKEHYFLESDRRAETSRLAEGAAIDAQEELREATITEGLLQARMEKNRTKNLALVQAAVDHAGRRSFAEGTLRAAIKEMDRLLAANINPHLKQIENCDQSAKLARADLAHAEERASAISQEAMLAAYWKDAFKEIRLLAIKRILLMFEIEATNAAEALGLVGWRFAFLTETENKSGTMKQGVQIQIFTPDGANHAWETWSGGEGQRLRLAVSLGFASMAQRMAGVVYDFEVWDEPSAWLSPEGIEDLLEALRNRADQQQKSVWLLDHRAFLHSGFSEIWQVRKDDAGASIHRLA